MADDNDTRRWEEFQKRIRQLNGSFVKIGVLSSSGPAAEGSITMVELAAIHEFGSPNAGIPERSFIRSTVRNRADDIRSQCTKLVKAVLAGNMETDQALGALGSWVAAQMKNTISTRKTEGPEPQENKDSTIKQKGSSTPLIDTGRLLGAITWEVTVK